jgi:hypothetical protein
MASERVASFAEAQSSILAISSAGIRALTRGSFPVAGRPRLFFECTLIDFAIKMTRADRVLSTPPTNSPIDTTSSEALALIERCRKGDRRWDVLYNKIDSAEKVARDEFGRRPFELIEWRNYSAIGCSEIERARDEFIRDGIDEKVVQAEYRSAKRRYREAARAGDDWDRKVGLTDLRKEYDDNRCETRAAWKALGKVPVTSMSDALAIIDLLRERMRKFSELSDDWEVAAFMNASRFLARAAERSIPNG